MNPMSKVSSTVSYQTLAEPMYATEPWITPKRWAKYTGDVGWMCSGVLRQTPWTDSALSVVLPEEIAALQRQVSTQCQSGIGRGDLNNLENIAEANQTLSMLRNPISSWFRFSRKAKIATAAMSAANAWLTYRYGIKPLVQSIDGTLKNLAKGLTNSPIQTTRASGVITRRIDDTVETDSVWHVESKFVIARSRTETIRVRAVSLDEMRWESLQLLGMSPKDMLTLPWELVPFSFVVDWFMNVGDYLGAMAQGFAPSSIGQCLTTESIRSEYRVTNADVSWNPTQLEVLQQGMGSCRTDVIIKSRTPGLSTPSLQPKVNFRLTEAERAADAVSIIGQQLLQTFTNRR